MPTFVRRVASGALMLALVGSMVTPNVTSVQAQGQAGSAAPGVWQTAINLQNTAGVAASVQIDFYGADGSIIKTYIPSTTIPANGSLEVFVPSKVSDLPTGQYSAVVSSDQPVKATINTASTNNSTGPWTAFGYEGISAAETGTTLSFPGLYKNYYNFFSELVIQNADTAAATLTAKFYKRDGTQIGGDIALGTLAPNASKTFAMNSLTVLPSGNTDGIFAAVITSSESRKLAGLANIWRTSPTNGTASYNAFTSGSANLFAPALYNNYYGFASSLTLQAVGGAASGTITYSNGKTEPFSLAANAAQEFYQAAPNNGLPSGNTAGVFSAKVTTTSGQVVGVVNASVPDGARGDFASYNMAKAATANVSIPNVMDDYYGYFSAVTVQNTSGAATNITIKYATGQSRTFSNVPANGTVNIAHLRGANAGDVLPDRTATSAIVSSSNGAPLVAVVQHNTERNVAGYNAAKAPSDFLLALTGSPQ